MFNRKEDKETNRIYDRNDSDSRYRVQFISFYSYTAQRTKTKKKEKERKEKKTPTSNRTWVLVKVDLTGYNYKA